MPIQISNVQRPSNKSLDASGISGLFVDNLSVTRLLPAASTQPLGRALGPRAEKETRGIPEQCDELEADVVSGEDLIVGGTYFMVTYPDSLMCIPIVITYRYLGPDPDGVEEDEPGPHYYFRYLPAFQSESDEDDAQNVFAWAEVFPDGFSGWGESAPTSFSQEELSGFESLDGLVEELMRVRSRLAERNST